MSIFLFPQFLTFLELFIDEEPQEQFSKNYDFFSQYNSVFVNQNEEQARIVFQDGVTLEFSISSAQINDTKRGIQQISWIICNIYLANQLQSYNKKFLGLLGNFDENKENDIFYRNLTKLENINSEQEIYPVANDCNFILNNFFKDFINEEF